MSERRYLILQLRAPLAAFGGATVDNFGVTRRFPARSLLTGLLANALGWRRSDFKQLSNLQNRLCYAVRLESPVDGRQWRDFQTVELAKNDKHWTTSGEPASRAGGTYGGPHLRYRDYLHDLQASVALSLHEESASPTVQNCEAALQRPARPLFIGRKPCLPSAPLWQQTVTARNALEALKQAPFEEAGSTKNTVPCFWMPGEGDPLLAQQQYAICDERDWANSQHVGSRPVYEADIATKWFHPGEQP